MTDLIFLDTETTGLDSDIHQIWEVSYAINSGGIITEYLPHDVATADLGALSMNGYRTREYRSPDHPDIRLKQALEGNTLVGANIGFDVRFLKARWKSEPWHYRTIDVESMALAILEYDRPKGLKAIRDDLDKLGYVLADPDHSAGNDVAATRDVYHILRLIQKEKTRAHEGPARTAS